MTGIGNDIVALKTIDSLRTQSPRFYTKILASSEQQLYHEQLNALPFEHFVWLLWSIKESAYKCLQRYQPQLVFSPVKITLTQLIPPSVKINQSGEIIEATGFNDAECFCGTLLFQSQTLHARSLIYGDEVLITVTQPIGGCHGELVEQRSEGLRQAQADNPSLNHHSFNHVHWGIKHIGVQTPENESTSAKEFLIKRLRTLYPEQALSIRKDDSGCPHFFANGQDTHRPISLSHHEGYVGYAFV